jgi:tRNA pseudouridine55 synthase
MNGILAIDKPYGWTSHDVVARVRVLARQRRIGHAGTLDPMATGVLLVCLGDATRVSDALMEGTKWYLARVAFGATTTTDDALGTVTSLHSPGFALGQLVAILKQFVGSIEQRPPAFAAIKRDGVPAYKRARMGQDVELAPRHVKVHCMSLLDFSPLPEDPPREGMIDVAVAGQASGMAYATLLISCSKGTYIRSIARDVGTALGCGAHLCALRRLASGSFTTRDTISVQNLQSISGSLGPAGITPLLAPLDRALDGWPAFVANAQQARSFVTGVRFSVNCDVAGPRARVYDGSGMLLGLADLEHLQPGSVTAHPSRVFAGAAS